MSAISFSCTGVASIDAILEAVEDAANGCHDVSQWEDGEREEIERVAQVAAKSWDDRDARELPGDKGEDALIDGSAALDIEAETVHYAVHPNCRVALLPDADSFPDCPQLFEVQVLNGGLWSMITTIEVIDNPDDEAERYAQMLATVHAADGERCDWCAGCGDALGDPDLLTVARVEADEIERDDWAAGAGMAIDDVERVPAAGGADPEIASGDRQGGANGKGGNAAASTTPALDRLFGWVEEVGIVRSPKMLALAAAALPEHRAGVSARRQVEEKRAALGEAIVDLWETFSSSDPEDTQIAARAVWNVWSAS